MIRFANMTADEAERFMSGKEAQRIRSVVAERVDKRDVIDLGCGRGIHIARDYAPGQYLGLDCSPELIKIAQRINPEHQFLVHDIRTPIKIKADVAIIKSVLEHQPTYEDALAIFKTATESTDEVLVCWHTPPIEDHTRIFEVQAELDEPIYQNHYKKGSFDLEDLSIEKERVDEFELWTVHRRGSSSDLSDYGAGDGRG